MSKTVGKLSRDEQPMNWKRAFLAGVVGATLMMGFMDCFNAMGLTRFSFEIYLGTMFTRDRFAPASWTLGVLLNWVLGGIFGIFYSYCFEYVFSRASARIGGLLGFGHAALAAFAFFPFCQICYNQMGTTIYPDFGFFGSQLGLEVPVLLLVSHLIFGVCMGAFYGPARAGRIRMREFEPG